MISWMFSLHPVGGTGTTFLKIEGLWCCGTKTNLALKAITKIISIIFHCTVSEVITNNIDK